MATATRAPGGGAERPLALRPRAALPADVVSHAPEDSPDRRVERLVSGLDATLGVGATIRATAERGALELVLPVLSIDVGGAPGDRSASGERARPPADLELRGLLGAGGMGAVYAARQRALDRDVALKRPIDADASPEARAALLGEARTMGALEHPNIVPVHALGTDHAGQPVLVMKRIEGVSWRALLDDPRHPMWERLGTARDRGLLFHVEVLMQVCNALHFAHSRGVVHRDVKPDNVMIGAFGEIYLLDWGIARRLGAPASPSIVGTPSCMAPEMLLDPASADERTDVYLVGATLYELLAGRALHPGASLAEVFHAVLEGAPPSLPDAPPDLAALCLSTTSADRARRPPSCEAVRDTLAAHLVHRASRELATAAAARLADAEARLSVRPADLASVEVGVLLAECRFGFEASLREWRDNEAAVRGLARCLEHAIEREILQRNAAAARALLAALPAPSPRLEERVRELEQEIEAARAREAQHAARARELDASVSAWPRILALAVFLVVGGGLSLAAFVEERETGEAMSMDEQLRLDVAIGALFVVGLALARKRLLTNAYNRQLWGTWGVAIAGMGATDFYLAGRGLDAVAATVVDFTWLAAVFALAALTFSRPLGWAALGAVATAAATACEPSLATPAATLWIFGAVALMIEQSRRSALDAAARDGATRPPAPQAR